MDQKFFRVGLVITLLTIFLSSCGKKVQKENLSADAYFEYAKSLFDRKKYVDAITEFTVITLKFSGNPVVDDAQFYLAESHFLNDEYLIAGAEYQKMINDYPESAFVEEAFYKMGLSYYNLSQRSELDQEYTLKALRQFQNFIEAYPESPFREQGEQRLYELRIKLSRKQLMGGDVYRKMGIYDSAIIYYSILLDKYYDTPLAEPALYWKAECLYRIKEYEEALTNYTALVEKFPKSRYQRAAKGRISEIQDKK